MAHEHGSTLVAFLAALALQACTAAKFDSLQAQLDEIKKRRVPARPRKRG